MLKIPSVFVLWCQKRAICDWSVWYFIFKYFSLHSVCVFCFKFKPCQHFFIWLWICKTSFSLRGSPRSKTGGITSRRPSSHLLLCVSGVSHTQSCSVHLNEAAVWSSMVESEHTQLCLHCVVSLLQMHQFFPWCPLVPINISMNVPTSVQTL